MSTIYCTYLTVYKGNKLPPFYIGSSTVKNVESNYHGSVASKKYKLIWRNELKEHPELFKTKIISLHETSKESREKELKLQRELKVVESTLYINQDYASVNGYFGVIVTGKDHVRYGMCHTEESRKKISENHHDVSGKNNHWYGKTGENNPRSISFWAIDPNGIKCLATSINQFAKLHNLTASNIVEVLKGRQTHHKNWTFGYIDPENINKNSLHDHSIYKFFNVETKETFEGRRAEFVRKYNLQPNGVYCLINNKQKHHRNWILLEKLS